MSKKVLVFVSEHGFWVEELVKPVKRLEQAGFNVEYWTPTGAIPFPDGASLELDYEDPPLGRKVTKQDVIDMWKERDWIAQFQGCTSLKKRFPIRPYMSSSGYLVDLEAYYQRRDEAWKSLAGYDALLMVGGSGPIVDMVNNSRLHDMILGFYYADKPIAAECYAVTCLAFARELDDRRSILSGRHVTGHTMEYDYTAGWSLMANGAYFDFGGPPISLEYILRDTVAPNGQFHGNVGRPLSVIVDYPFITSRSVGESDLCGEMLVRVLNGDRSAFGWKPVVEGAQAARA